MRRNLVLGLTLAIVAVVMVLAVPVPRAAAPSADETVELPGPNLIPDAPIRRTQPTQPTQSARPPALAHFERPAAAPSVAAPAQDDADSGLRIVDLESLDPQFREHLVAEGLERIHELGEACGHAADASVRLAAFATLDPAGLVELDLTTYSDDELPDSWQEALPEDLHDCVEDQLWDQPWPGSPEGTELPVMLTVRFDREP